MCKSSLRYLCNHELTHWNRSHPASKNYGKHWTSEEVINRFAPQHTTVEAVKTWLTDFGIDANRITHSDNKIWFAFDATVNEADRLLAAEYHDFEHASGFITLGCDRYVHLIPIPQYRR